MSKRQAKPVKPMAHVKQTHPMWRYGKDPQQPRITAYVGLVLIVVLLIWGIGQLQKFPIWLNDQRLDMLARDVFNTELPENSTYTSRQYDRVNLPDERMCAFVVRQDMRSQLSEYEIKAFYREIDYGLRFPPFAMINKRYAPNITFASGSSEVGDTQYALVVRIELTETSDPRCSE